MTWILITERLPTKEECEKDAGWFLVMRKNFGSRADISRYDGHEDYFCFEHGWKYACDDKITHWMPLPELPNASQI